jgi:hypothetical protein
MNKDDADFMWGMYQEHLTHGRHHEVQRTNLGSILVAISAGILAFIANKDVLLDKRPLIYLLIFIGFFGALFTLKLSERARFHLDLAGRYRKKLDNFTTAEYNITKIREDFIEDSNYQLKFFKDIRLYLFWMAIYFVIIIIGISLLVQSFK